MESISRLCQLALPVVLAAVFTAGAVNVAATASATDFYKDKTVKLIIRSGPGGGNDFYGRLLARHMGKYMRGNPDFLPQNMPGGGGLLAANYMYNRAKRDGTEIAILSRDLANLERLGAAGVRYKTLELIPLGSAVSSVRVFFVRKDHPVNSLKDLKNYGKTVKFSGTGAGTGATQQINQLKDAGFPVQVITGYMSTEEKILAVLRGEVDGTNGSYGSLKGPIKEEGFKIIAKMGNHPDLNNVTDIRETLLDDDARAAANFMAAAMIGGRPFFTAPKVPADRVAILRTAFKKALEDPKLRQEAARAKRDVSWTGAEDLGEIYKEVMGASDRVVAKIKNPGGAKPMLKHKGKVTKTKREGREVFIDYKGKEVSADISKSRTKVTIGGKSDQRGNIKVGMTCQFTYPQAGAEATNVDCE